MPESTTAVIICSCSGCLGDAIDWGVVKQSLAAHPSRPAFIHDELACSVNSQATLAGQLAALQPTGVVVAACTPRDHEATFRAILTAAGINPHRLRMVPVREQVAWTTPDSTAATAKTIRLLRAALDRLQHQEPLFPRTVPVCTDVVIIGSGPAGLQAARLLIRAGRRVTLVEREPFLGGMPVRLEELAPSRECGPCLLEPLLQEVLQAADAGRLQLRLLAEVTGVTGQLGAWTVTISQRPRYVRPDSCIGCQSCVAACPARTPCNWSPGSERPAISLPFAGALPAVPFIDDASCIQLQGGSCGRCRDACPVPGTIVLEATPQVEEVPAGAIIVATGAVEQQQLPPSFAGQPDVYTAYAFERLLAQNGPTAGRLVLADGRRPSSLAIVQCAGSLDPAECAYCSGICCQIALKITAVAQQKEPKLKITRLVREQVTPGPAATALRMQDMAEVRRYNSFQSLALEKTGGSRVLRDGEYAVPAEMIVLCRPLLPSLGTARIGDLLRLGRDAAGFLAPLHPQTAASESARKGIYLAGSCREPGSIRDAFTAGSAVAGQALSDLLSGQDLIIDPEVAVVDDARCTGCRLCLPLCPYQAIGWDEGNKVASISDLLCLGCGTCVAACPSGAITARGASRAAMRAEMQGLLR